MYLQAFLIAFFATLGLEVALGLCLAIGSIFKGASKNGKN
jgi:hypothetical protein